MIGIKRKPKKHDMSFRYGMATLKDGTEVKRARRTRIFDEYEYTDSTGRDITSSVVGFRCDEYIDEKLKGYDPQVIEH